MTPPNAADAARAVLTEVARADRRRRARTTVTQLARVAPAGAAVVLMTASLGRWLGWRPVLPLGLLAVLLIGLAIWTILGRRMRAVSDATAARVDAEAGLAGELRSAHWFADQPEVGPWPVFHLERAAKRLADVAWEQVYPPVRANRAWAMTGLLVVASLFLSYRVPPPRAASQATAGKPAGEGGPTALPLTADQAKKLQDLLAKAQMGNLTPEEAKQLADASKLLSKLDSKVDPKMAELAKKLEQAVNKNAQNRMADGETSDAAAEDMKAAMEDLASKLAKGQAERSEGNPNEAPNADDKQFGKSSAAGAQAKAVQASVQMVREAASENDNQQMLPAGGAPGGDSAAGRGGNNGDGKGAGELLKLQADALKKELIEANTDTAGQNVTKEDLRRKTEQGRSNLSFTRVAGTAVLERGRAVPPPPVPDARKSLVQSYFIRKQ
jgi:hypothetical protein